MSTSASTPQGNASQRFKKSMDQILTSNITIDMNDFKKMYNNLYGITRPVNLTSSQTTEKILANSLIPYNPPFNIHKAELYRQAALEHKESKWVAYKANKESQNEVENAIKRLQNKKMKKSNQEAQKKSLEQKIKKLDDNVQYIVDLYKTINDAREKQDIETRKNQERLKNIRQSQQETIKKIRLELVDQKMMEKRKLQSISQINNMAIQKRNEEIYEQNLKRRLEMQERKKENQNKMQQCHNSRISNLRDSSFDNSEENEEKLFKAEKIIRKIKEEEQKILDDMRFNEQEKHRMKTELGLVLPGQRHHASQYESQGYQTPQNITREYPQKEEQPSKGNTFLTSV